MQLRLQLIRQPKYLEQETLENNCITTQIPKFDGTTTTVPARIWNRQCEVMFDASGEGKANGKVLLTAEGLKGKGRVWRNTTLAKWNRTGVRLDCDHYKKARWNAGSAT